MASVSSDVEGLPLEQLDLYHAADPLLSSVFIFYGPIVTANSTTSSSRVQAHIFTAGGFQSYPRFTISPAAPLYAAVNHLPRERQGDGVYRALSVCLLKYFGELSDPVKIGLLSIPRGGRDGNRSPRTFDEIHAADLANKMSRIDNAPDVVRDLKNSFPERRVPCIDVDLVLPAGTITTSKSAHDPSEDSALSEEFVRQYGKYSSLIAQLGEPVFLPTSKLRRAPSKPTNSSKSRLFSADQKESLRLTMCEVVDTEERYVGKMYDLVHNIVKHFQQKAAEKSSSSSSPDEKALAKLFPPCLGEILQVNMGFLEAIRETLEQTEQDALADMSGDTNVDSTFLKRDSNGNKKDPLGIIAFAQSLVDWFPHFSQPYGDYMRTHDGFSQVLGTFLNNQHSSFSKRVYETGEQKMRSLLMEPVQRLPRYSLLIDTMTAALPVAHPAVRQLLKARDIITEICSLESHPSRDGCEGSKRLQNLVSGLPNSNIPSGRLITAVDFLEVTPSLTYLDNGPSPGILLLYTDMLLLLSKAQENSVTARGLYTELDKPPSSEGSDELTSLVNFSQGWQITSIRCTQSVCGRILYITPAENFVQGERLHSREIMYAIEPIGNYENKVSRLIEDITKARIEARFPEHYRESGKWTLHTLRPTGESIGILLSVFEEEPGESGIPREPCTVRLAVGNTKMVRPKELGRSAVEVIVSISNTGVEKYRMELDSVVGITSSDTFNVSDFVPTITSKRK